MGALQQDRWPRPMSPKDPSVSICSTLGLQAPISKPGLICGCWRLELGSLCLFTKHITNLQVLLISLIVSLPLFKKFASLYKGFIIKYGMSVLADTTSSVLPPLLASHSQLLQLVLSQSPSFYFSVLLCMYFPSQITWKKENLYQVILVRVALVT